MRITVLATTASLKSLIETAGYDLNVIEAGRMKDKNSSNNYKIYIRNHAGGQIVYAENLFPAVVTEGYLIAVSGVLEIEVQDIAKLNLISTTGTQTMDLFIA